MEALLPSSSILAAFIGGMLALAAPCCVTFLFPATDSVADLQEMATENDVSGIPLLSDADASVSRAYDVLGRGMHKDKPGHTFILVDKQGITKWRTDYFEMYIPDDEILRAVQSVVAASRD